MTSQAVGLGAAVDYLTGVGMDAVHEHELALTGCALDAGRDPGSGSSARPTRSTAAARSRSSSTASTRTTSGRSSTTAASRSGSGHHCAWPLHRRFGVAATVRASSRCTTPPTRSTRWSRRARGPGLLRGGLMQLEQMYQEIILDHYRTPHRAGLRDPFDAEVHHVNPTCGDEVTLRVQLDGRPVADVSYESLGCSISQASTSVLTDVVVGRRDCSRGAGRVHRDDGQPRHDHRTRTCSATASRSPVWRSTRRG